MGRIGLIALALLLLAAPASWAQASNAPPGNSAVDQYVEAVPSASGGTPSKHVGGAKPGTVSPTVSKALSGRGSSGTELKRLIAATSPQPAATAKAKAKHKSGRATDGAKRHTSVTPSSPVGAAAAAATGSGGGMGIWLPLLLGAVALTAVAVVLLRARARAAGPRES